MSHSDGTRPRQSTDVVLDYIRDQGGNGTTVEEIEDTLGLASGDVAITVALLLMQGHVETRGMQRLNRANRLQNVYFATED